jgi:hypothetical protein
VLAGWLAAFGALLLLLLLLCAGRVYAGCDALFG